MKQKILFSRTETWPYANIKLAQVLQNEFPECELMTIDVYERIKSQPAVIIRNAMEVMRLYGRDVLTRKKRFRRVFWRTPYIFHQIKKIIREAALDQDVLFSFQMQSIFDGSIDEHIPHFVYTDHTHLANLSYPNFDRSKLYHQDWIELERTIYSNASLLFVRSSNIIGSLVNEYQCPPSRVICAYAGSNAVEKEYPTNASRYGKKHILFVGIDWERKGGPDLLKAFELTQRSHPDATLTIVGCSPEVNIPNCHVIGRVPVHMVSQYFNEASVFCLPTRLEPFGVAFVEAMASRLPIVASNVGAIPDFVHDGVTGFIVKPGDVNAMANALSTLISDPEKCRSFGEKGYQLAQRRYTWKAVGKRMRKHIMDVLSDCWDPIVTPKQEPLLPCQDSLLSQEMETT